MSLSTSASLCRRLVTNSPGQPHGRCMAMELLTFRERCERLLAACYEEGRSKPLYSLLHRLQRLRRCHDLRPRTTSPSDRQSMTNCVAPAMSSGTCHSGGILVEHKLRPWQDSSKRCERSTNRTLVVLGLMSYIRHATPQRLFQDSV